MKSLSDQVIYEHLAGKRTVGVFPLMTDDMRNGCRRTNQEPGVFYAELSTWRQNGDSDTLNAQMIAGG